MSALIRYLTNSPCSHVAIRFSGEESNWMVEAASKGVYPGWWHYFNKKNTIIDRFEIVGIDEVLLEKVVDEALDEMVGEKYDILGLIGFAIAIAVKAVTGKVIKNIFGSKKMMFCSEFILRVSNKIKKELGIQIFEGDPELTSPGEEWEQAKNNQYLKRLYDKNSA